MYVVVEWEDVEVYGYFSVPPLGQSLFITDLQVTHFSAFMHGPEEDLKF